MKKNNTQLFVAIILTAFLLSSCISNRPIASSYTLPDYNGRVVVHNPKNKRKANFMGVTVGVALPVAGGVLGSQSELVKYQDGNTQKSSAVGGAVAGALAGAGVSYLIGQMAGYNKNTEVKDIDKWVKKAHPDYLILETTPTRYTLIDRKVESRYIVKNMQDVRDFKKVFPGSYYTDNMFQRAVESLNRDDLPELIALYPANKYVETAKAVYIKKSVSFDDAMVAARKYPLQNADELCVVKITTPKNAIDFNKQFPTTNYKKLAVINAFNTAAPTQAEMRALKNTYSNLVYLDNVDLQTKNDNIRSHYYMGMYNLIVPVSSTQFDKFNADYAWLNYSNKNRDILSTYWDINDKLYYKGKDVIYNFKSILANPQYANYKITETDVKQLMSEKFQAEVMNNVKILSKKTIGQNNDEWEKWKNSPYTAGMVHEQGEVKYILYGEIQNDSKYDLPVVLGGGAVLQEVVSIQGRGEFMNAIINLGAALSGQSLRETRDVAGVVDYYYFPVILANEKVIYALLLDFGTQMKNMGINLFDWIKGIRELNLHEIQAEVRYNADPPSRAQLEKQDNWQRLAKYGGLPASKLTDFWRGEEVRQDIWDIRYEDYKERWREALQNASSSSGSGYDDDDDDDDKSSSSSSNSNIDPETVSVPNYDEISSRWLDDSGRDRYKKVVWYGDVEGYIYIDKDGDIYFKYGGWGGSKVYYNTEKNAIDALYVEKKYNKLRKKGKK